MSYGQSAAYLIRTDGEKRLSVSLKCCNKHRVPQVHRLVIGRGTIYYDDFHEEYGQPPKNPMELVLFTFQANRARMPLCYEFGMNILMGQTAEKFMTPEECVRIFKVGKREKHTMAEVYQLAKDMYDGK